MEKEEGGGGVDPPPSLGAHRSGAVVLCHDGDEVPRGVLDGGETEGREGWPLGRLEASTGD